MNETPWELDGTPEDTMTPLEHVAKWPSILAVTIVFGLFVWGFTAW